MKTYRVERIENARGVMNNIISCLNHDDLKMALWNIHGAQRILKEVENDIIFGEIPDEEEDSE